MANSDKNILITPNIGSSSDPKIEFKGADTSTGPSTITAVVYPTNNGTLSFNGSVGELFSITNNLTSGSIFAVNDVSGVPSIDVNADGTILLGTYGGNIGVGTTNATSKLSVVGNASISGTLSATTGSFSSTLTVGGAIVRSAAGVGYLSGNYYSSESSSTSGAIYSIGGAYVPTSTTLGTMYGIGYGYAGNGGIGNPGGVGNSIWGMYVASDGTARIFLDSDNGVSYATGSHRSPIFYDSDNTAYYTDPASTSNLNGLTAGTTTLGDTRINFASGGGGHSFGAYHYSMGKDIANTGWSHPHYSDLIIGYHTGIRLGAAYSGIRFYNNSPTTDANNDGNGDNGESLLMTIGGYVGNSGQDVNVNNILYAGASMRAPIFYDSNDTAYYTDPASTSILYQTRTYIAGNDTNGNWNTGFQNTPTSSYNFHGDISSGGPAGAWWFYESMRHSNGAGYWGTQVAWGWEDNANRLFQRNVQNGTFSAWVEYLNTSQREFAGYLQMAASMRAPIFYDSDNTAYYTDPASTSKFLRHNISSGQPDGTVGSLRVSSSTNGASEINSDTYTIMLGPASSRTGAGYYYSGIAINGLMNYSGGTGYDTAAHIWLGAYYRDTPGSERSDFIVAVKSGTGNTGTGSDLPQVRFRVDYEGIASATGSSRAPIFYDSDNTAYYTDPASGSNLAGTLTNNGGTGMTGGWNRNLYLVSTFPVIVFNSNSTKYSGIGVDYSVAAGGMYFWVNGSSADIPATGTVAMNIDTGNYVQAAGSFRAPLFYDSNDTAYYTDPASTSVLNNVQVTTFGVGTAASGTTGEIRATNNVTAYYSDERLKENINPISSALTKLLTLRGVTFNSNKVAEQYGYIDKKEQVGVIAQDVEKVLPQVVVPAPFDIAKDKDGNEYSKSGENYKTVHYDKLVPLLIEAIKEQQIQINDLKNMIINNKESN